MKGRIKAGEKTITGEKEKDSEVKKIELELKKRQDYRRKKIELKLRK